MPQEIPSYKTLLPPECIRENCMGPNPLPMLEELLSAAPLPPGARVLDLGCGRGITSMYLAKAWGAQVFALDLWIQPGENYARIREMGLEASVKVKEQDASISLKLPSGLGQTNESTCQTLLAALMVHCVQLAEEYPENISVMEV